MASDDVFYALAISLSVIIGPSFRCIRGEESRRLLSTAIGFVLLVFLCGYNVVHLVITVLGNFLILSVAQLNNKCHISGFVWNFGYLAIFRTVHYIGIQAPSAITNAAQLFLTLRMIGLCCDIHDTHTLQKKPEAVGDSKERDKAAKEQLLLKYTYINPSLKDVACFAFCYIGVLTGPFYKYHIYQDWLRQENPEQIPLRDPFLAKAKNLPVICVTYLFFSYFFSIKYVETDDFYDYSFWFRLFYMVPMFIIFRTRLYMAWLLSECMCITAGFGAYPREAEAKCGSGPTNLKALEQSLRNKSTCIDDYDYETVHNLHIWGCELAPTTKQGLRSWNMTVQYWLATYVHRRVPQSLKAYRVSITMAVSAFWHGIHPGYYLSFLTVPPILMAEEAMIAGFRTNVSCWHQRMFDWGCWFFKMRGFDYMCMGFLLLKLSSTLQYWYSVYFLGHLVTLMFFFIGTAGKMMKSKERRKKD